MFALADKPTAVRDTALTRDYLPPQYVAEGWEIKEDCEGWVYAEHPAWGKTTSAYLISNRPDLSIKMLLDRVALLRPQEPELKRSRISPRLPPINDGVADTEATAVQLGNEIERLNRSRCTGRPWYKTLPSGTSVMYAQHPTGTTCPRCGAHPSGGRLRRYCGEEETVTANNALEAMADHSRWLEATAELDQLNRTLQQVDRLLWQLEALCGVNKSHRP